MSDTSAYVRAYNESLDNPAEFWLNAANDIEWVSKPQAAFGADRTGTERWFPGAQLNTSVNALDRHVSAGHGDRTALVYDSAMIGVQRTFTYRELLDVVARCAGALSSHGVNSGDRVIIYMPMIPETVIAMLACARIGAIHSVVFGGFAAEELAKRIDDAAPVAVLTASGGFEPGRNVEYAPIVEQALRITSQNVDFVMLKKRDGFQSAVDSTWIDWDSAISTARPAEPIPVEASQPLYILYTSGTTGRPKGVVRDNGGHAVALAWTMKNIYGVGPGDVMWAASDVGWVVGHSYIVYAPLLVGATTVLYEGKPVGTPDAGAFWRVVADHHVKVLFTAPTALRAIRKADPGAEFTAEKDLSSLTALFVAGERLDPGTFAWAVTTFALPVIDHWWQTETGWAIAATAAGMGDTNVVPGSSGFPMPGYGVKIVDDAGSEVAAGTEGNVVIDLPLPPGTLTGLWQDKERYERSYLSSFPGSYSTGDSGYKDSDDHVFVLGRSDDVINVAGHRLSTGGMEAVVSSHPAVAECAVIGVPDELKGQRPHGYVVLKTDSAIDPETLREELAQLVRDRIGAVASFHNVTVVDGLPKTRSGKILRNTMRQISAGVDYVVPATIEDPAVLSALEKLHPHQSDTSAVDNEVK